MSTAVLVHGAWSSPADWHWVAERLSTRGIDTATPDLPSHQRGSADRHDDVQAVEAAANASSPPVTVVGWSYGGAVVSDMTDVRSVDRLPYVGYVPSPADPASPARFDPSLPLTAMTRAAPWLLTPDVSTVVLDND